MFAEAASLRAMARWLRWAWVLGLGLLPSGRAALADGTVYGVCWFEQLKGTGARYTNLHEWNVYLTPSWSMFANPLSYRCNHGDYTFTNPAGAYTIYVNQPEFFGRAKVVRNVQVLEGQTVRVDPELNLDYSCFYKNEWPGGWGSPWYQTFIATGTSINKIAYSCASGDTGMIEVSLLRDTGGNVTTWAQVGTTKSSGSSFGENWVGYRSGELPTIPGQRYAIRLAGAGGTPFSPYWRTDNGNGYTGGQAYDPGGNPQNKDLCLLVFSDNDGTVIPYMKTTGGMGSTTWWEWQWGQTFKATGESLAAVDLWFSSGDDWNMQMWFRVYANPPSGGNPPSGQVGVSKRGRGAWQAGGSGMMAISYEPGEVPLVTGNTYYIEMTPYGPPPNGYSPWKMNNPADAYPYGHAYANRNPQPDIDLSMTIMEYAVSGPPPAIQRNPASFTHTIVIRENLPNDAFTIRNSGSGLLSYTIADDASWLGVSPDNGSVYGEEIDQIDIIYGTSSLSAGAYTGTITITAPGASNSPQYVTVYLTVLPHGPCDFGAADGDVDQEDFGHLQECLTGGPGIPWTDPACADADLDRDVDVDQDDMAIFLGCRTGPGIQGSPPCTR